MRLPGSAFGVALAGFLVFGASDAAAAGAGLVVSVLLVLLGYRNATLRALRWALLVPAAAFVADVITFTPLSPQTGPEANLYTYAAVLYLPLWAFLVAAGVVAARGRRRSAHRAA
jgi:hypothetical protein